MVRAERKGEELMLTCREVTKLVSESMESRLSWRKRVGMRIHFMMCVSCARYRRQLFTIRKLIHNYLSEEESQTDAGDHLSPESRQRMKRALKDAESNESTEEK